MTNNDLIPKKSVSLELDTYARLSKLAANLRADNPGGGFVSMSAAVAVLLDGWKELERMANNDVPCFTGGGQVMGQVTTGFLEQYFSKPENETE